MKVTAAEFEWMLVCTFRYSLGRRSVAPHLAVEIIGKYRHHLQPFQRKQFIEDLDSAFARDAAGDAVDIDQWLTLRHLLTEES